jgi:hypothetical protein
VNDFNPNYADELKMTNPILAEGLHGPLIASRHRGAIAVADGTAVGTLRARLNCFATFAMTQRHRTRLPPIDNCA